MGVSDRYGTLTARKKYEYACGNPPMRAAPDARTLGAMDDGAPGTLTPREHQVATLLAYGHTNQEIGDRLGVSVRTVEMHRSNVLRKLGATSRASVVRWALDNDLLQ